MKQYIFKTMLFLIPLLIVAISLEIILRMIPNEYRYKREYLDKYSNDIETLILGSSHTYMGLNPEYFTSNTFNAAHSGQLPLYDYKILEKYKKNLKNLKTIILPISYASLFKKYNSFELTTFKKKYKYFFESDTFYIIEITEHSLYNNLKKINTYHKNKTTKYNKLGWCKIDNYINNEVELANSAHRTLPWETFENIKSDENQKIFYENVSFLKYIIQWSKTNNVDVILFTPPAYKTYYNNLNKEQMSETINKAIDFTKKFDNCTYINLLDDPRYIAKDFWDASHLSDFGAEKLSRYMDSVVQYNYYDTKANHTK